jgi:hypothetical protein
MIELKPCPFCGEVPEVTKHFREDMWRLIHRCKAVGCIVVDWASQEWIEECWNQRAESAPRWIPVEERLPEDGAACVVWALGDYRIADYSIIPGKWSIMDWDCTHEEIAVTHWMPLPDAPKEGE